MSDIHVVEPHNTTSADAIQKVAAFEEMLKKYRAKLVWKGNTAQVKGTGVKGSVRVDDTNATVEIKLGRIAKAVGIDAKRLEGSIRKRLKTAFGTADD